jgi:hypothetical protein
VHFQPQWDQPPAGALDRTAALVDPDHVLYGRGFRGPAGRGSAGRGDQVGGQRGEFTEGSGGKGGRHALAELISGQAAVRCGGAEYVNDPVPVGV